jgi:hypothetical protein
VSTRKKHDIHGFVAAEFADRISCFFLFLASFLFLFQSFFLKSLVLKELRT